MPALKIQISGCNAAGKPLERVFTLNVKNFPSVEEEKAVALAVEDDLWASEFALRLGQANYRVLAPYPLLAIDAAGNRQHLQFPPDACSVEEAIQRVEALYQNVAVELPL
jgi:hypothetical protein